MHKVVPRKYVDTPDMIFVQNCEHGYPVVVWFYSCSVAVWGRMLFVYVSQEGGRVVCSIILLVFNGNESNGDLHALAGSHNLRVACRRQISAAKPKSAKMGEVFFVFGFG